MTIPYDPARVRLEEKADRIRAELATTIEALLRRRHELVDVRLQLRKHAGAFLAAGTGLLLVASGAGALLYWRSRTRARRMRRERARALARFWEHPDRIARTSKPPVLGEIGRRILVGAVTFAAMAIIKRGVGRAIEIVTTPAPAALPPERRPTALPAAPRAAIEVWPAAPP